VTFSLTTLNALSVEKLQFSNFQGPNFGLNKNRLGISRQISSTFSGAVSEAAIDSGVPLRVEIRQNESRSVGSDPVNFDPIRYLVSDPTRARSPLSGVASGDFSVAAMARLRAFGLGPPFSKPEIREA
jgi:hypothetical protein